MLEKEPIELSRHKSLCKTSKVGNTHTLVFRGGEDKTIVISIPQEAVVKNKRSKYGDYFEW